MPDVSIMISAQDNYSSAIKAMSQVTKSFSKDAEEMERTLRKLNTNKTTLKLDANAALQELKTAEKQFAATGKEADGLKMQLAQANYDNIKRNLDLVTKGAKETERQMQKTGEAFRKADNQASGGGFKSIVGAVASSGALKMIGDMTLNAANTLVGSALGDAGGSIASSVLSSTISGMAMGSIIPGVGTALGAALGAGAGIISGVTQVFQKQDDAFKSYVQENTEAQLSQRSSDIQSGSGIAAQREQDAIAFNRLLGDGVGDRYLGDLRDLAARTPLEYGDLTGMSRSLATGFGDDPERMLSLMGAIGDAGSAVGIDASNMNEMAKAMSRMQSSGKATLEYLNIFQERGVDAIGMIADSLGTTKSGVYELISKSKLSGLDAVNAIQAGMEGMYGGAMEMQSKTFSGLTSTLSDAQAEMQNAYGEGYNEERGKGLQEQIDWFSGASGEAQEEANKAIGAWQASLENAKEEYIRQAVDEAMGSTEYQQAKAAGDAAEMGRIIMQAKVRGQSEYNANEGTDEALASELALAEGIRNDTRSNSAFWDAGYRKGEEYSKGLATRIADAAMEYMTGPNSYGKTSMAIPGGSDSGGGGIYTAPSYGSYAFGSYIPGKAFGMARVPYDNFPALLHQGERVLTASQARAADSGGGVHIGKLADTVVVREEADLDKLARKFVAEARRAQLLAAPS